MTQRNIAAWTPPGIAPPFVSVNEVGPGIVELMVRAPGKAEGSCGEVVTVTMSAMQMDSIASNILSGLNHESDEDHGMTSAQISELCELVRDRLTWYVSSGRSKTLHSSIWIERARKALGLSTPAPSESSGE